MATAVKQKKTFKESMQETGSKVKAYGQKKYEQAKDSAKRYGADIRTAYDIGYKRGWDDFLRPSYNHKQQRFSLLRD